MSGMALMPRLIQFLVVKRFIYTVRKHRYKMCSLVWIDEVGLCKRTEIMQITNKFDLEPYTVGSGFDSTEEWWNAIRCFIKSGEPMYLYKVEVNA